MTTHARHRLILRAELTIGGHTSVTRTREMSMTEIVVPLSTAPPLGERAELRLSFPGLVDTFVVSGTITAHHASDGPGELPGITITIADGAEAYHARLAELLAPSPEEGPPSLSYRILIVEDNGMIRDMFAYGVHKYFKSRGQVTVDVAPDGAEAWNLLVGTRYDLAIVDYYLPVVNGAWLISHIRDDERLANLPIVAISIGGEEARSASISAGADMFLDKPIVLRDLFATLDRLVGRRRSTTS
jgi:CheY-like chemotaxis protein